MKFYTLLACLLPLASFAQITITSDDLPQGASTYTLQESSPDPMLDYASSGAGVVWDFSGLDSNMEIVLEYNAIDNAPALAQLMFNNAWTQPDHVCDTYAPGDLPDFSEAGVELPVEIGSLYNYYQTSGSSHNIAGFTITLQGIDAPVLYTDIDETHQIPLNYGDQVSSTSAYNIDAATMFTYASNGTRSGEVDGWGTLMLPNGAEHEVLRLATTISKSDEFSTEGIDPVPFEYETTVYQWLGDGGVPYLEVQTAFGAAFRVRYQGEIEEEDTSNTDGITNIIHPEINIFPNPATSGSALTLKGIDANSTWEVRNAAGNICVEGMGNTLNTEGLTSGVYFLVHRTSATGLVSRPKAFIVQ